MSERLKGVAAKQVERQQQSQKNRELVVIIIVVVLGLAVFTGMLYWISHTLNASSANQQGQNQAQTEAPIKAQPKAFKPDIEPNTASGISQTIAKSDDARLEFETLFEVYQTDYVEAIQQLAQLSWSKTKANNVQADVRQASELYAQADFDAAKAVMTDAIGQSQSLLNEQDANVNSLLEKIETAFVAGSQAGVEQNLLALQSVSPNHPAVTQVQQSLEVLPEMTELSGKIKRYYAENRPELELQALRQLAKISQLSTQQQQRVQDLEGTTAQNALDSLLTRSRNALDKKDVASAQSLLNQAKQYAQSSSEVQLLQSRLNALKTELAIASHLRAAQNAVKGEQWAAAASSYQAILSLDATHAAAQDGLAQASTISNLLSKQGSLLERPLRVSDPKVKAYAQDLVMQSGPWLMASGQLKRSVEALKQLLIKVEQKKSVRFISDGKTTIKIQRLGFIQPTHDKTIELNPGEYKVFASCNKSFEAVSDLIVPLEGDVQPVKVVCGEGI